MLFTYHPTPIGRLLLAGDGRALARVGFPTGSRASAREANWREDPAPFLEARRQIDAYFEGRLRAFDLPLAIVGTPFRTAVWRALAQIPYGTTVSYGELAHRLGRTSASRAVGAANGANPLPLVLPCHRVIGSDGSLTGFGGGLALKRRLLDHEAVASGHTPHERAAQLELALQPR